MQIILFFLFDLYKNVYQWCTYVEKYPPSTINSHALSKNMGSKFSQCLGLKSYVRIDDELNAHPGLTSDSSEIPVVAFELDENSEENPESFFGGGTEV